MLKKPIPLFGPIIISLKSYELTNFEKKILSNDNIGGIILFSRNFVNKTQIINLISTIRKINQNLIIMLDHEGGRIWRFNNSEFTNPGPMQNIGELYNYDPAAALSKAYNDGRIIAKELIECDIDLNLAPVLDLDHNSISSVIGNRAFHSDPRIVAILAHQFIEGQKSLGIKAIGKHFPGHGGILADTHVSRAIDHRSSTEILSTDLIPFKILIQGDLSLKINPHSLPGLMPSHIIYSALDPINPAGFSSIWLQQILRSDLKFNGVIISDCLSMDAAQKFAFELQEENTIKIENLKGSIQQCKNLILTHKALQAGCDLIIFNKLHDESLEHLLINLAAADQLNQAEKLQRSQRIAKLSLINR